MRVIAAHRMIGGSRWGVFRCYFDRCFQSSGVETAPGIKTFSWETAHSRWRTFTVEFIYWRLTVSLWRLPVPSSNTREEGS